MVEVTCRTVQGRFLLKPTSELKYLVIGVLARAQRLYPVRVHAFVFMSNHYHLLLSVENARQLARFMNYANSNIAREAGRLHDWKERFWGRRYQSIVISQEESAQVSRLRYLLSHGCKEGLVARCRDWPGAHCVRALMDGRPIEGVWFDRTHEYAARARGERFRYQRYASRETMKLDPLPCWSHLSSRRCRNRIEALVVQIETEWEAQHAREDTEPLGLEQVLAQDPHDRPRSMKRAPAPAFHAATRAVRRELIEAYRIFVDAYRHAAERLREAGISVGFPEGCFPSQLPFVSTVLPERPG